MKTGLLSSDLEQYRPFDALHEAPQVPVIAVKIAKPAPPGCGSSSIGRGLPSGVSFNRPIWAIKEANVLSSVTRTRIPR